jgi:hypothetical protein
MLVGLACLLLIVVLSNGCGLGDDPDWLEAEAKSPDGRLIARLWCENFCDVAERATLTVSPADAPVALSRMHPDDAPEGILPERDRVAAVYGMEPGAEGPGQWRLEWRDPKLLVVATRCLSADGAAGPPPARRFRDVTIRFVNISSPSCAPAAPRTNGEAPRDRRLYLWLNGADDHVPTSVPAPSGPLERASINRLGEAARACGATELFYDDYGLSGSEVSLPSTGDDLALVNCVRQKVRFGFNASRSTQAEWNRGQQGEHIGL